MFGFSIGFCGMQKFGSPWGLPGVVGLGFRACLIEHCGMQKFGSLWGLPVGMGLGFRPGLIEHCGMQKFGSLWGLPGVVEQPIRRGKETALIFPIPAQVEGAVSQVSLLIPTAFVFS